MKLEYVKLTSPQGEIYIKAERILAFCNAPHTRPPESPYLVRTVMWVDGQQEHFNIVETVEQVAAALTTL